MQLSIIPLNENNDRSVVFFSVVGKNNLYLFAAFFCFYIYPGSITFLILFQYINWGETKMIFVCYMFHLLIICVTLCVLTFSDIYPYYVNISLIEEEMIESEIMWYDMQSH